MMTVGRCLTKQPIKRPGRSRGSLTPLTEAAYVCCQIAQTGSPRMKARKRELPRVARWRWRQRFGLVPEAPATISITGILRNRRALLSNEGAMQHWCDLLRRTPSAEWGAVLCQRSSKKAGSGRVGNAVGIRSAERYEFLSWMRSDPVGYWHLRLDRHLSARLGFFRSLRGLGSRGSGPLRS